MKCRTCASSELRMIMKFPKVPLVGDFCSNQEEAHKSEAFEMDLYFCLSCSLLQIAQNVELTKLFEDYSFSSSTIPNLILHFNDYAHWIRENFKPRSVLDVGCNDGVLLAPLEKMGIKAFGVDISRNITKIATAKGLNSYNLRLSLENLELIDSKIGKVDLITSSNAFPHNDRPHDFLDAAKMLLNKNGNILFEVMYAGDLQHKFQWDTVYHEHLHFHSIESLKNLLAMHNLYINHAELVPMHAGSLRISASRDKHKSRNLERLEDRELDLKINQLESWQKFADLSFRSMDVVRNKLRKLSEKKKKIWAYGASGRASMWLNCANLDMIEFIVDSSPLRYNKYVPKIGTPIVSPNKIEKNAIDYIFITAWNYSNEIIRQHSNFKGTWVTPLPQYKEIVID